MAMNLRLSARGEESLDHLIDRFDVSKTEIIERAIIEFDERTTHKGQVQAAYRRISRRDAEALELLSK